MGLKQSDVKNYWINRARQHGEATVEFSNSPEHAKIFNEKVNFIFEENNVARDFQDRRILDYGCGVGRFAQYSRAGSYLGVDITASLLDIGRIKNPNHNFHLLKDPKLPEKLLDGYFPQVFFTSTVLQHNDDDGVRYILGSLSDIVSNCDFILYENVHKAPDSGHMRFRSAQDYKLLIGEFFPVNHVTVRDHIVHGEKHALIIIK